MSLTSLRELAGLKENREGLLQQRHQRSEAALDQGIAHLATALGDPSGQKQAMSLACEAFLDTIRCNRREPSGYIGMAHVFLLLNQPREALPYLREARRVAPGDPDVELMFAHIQALGAKEPSGPGMADASFDRLEQTLSAALRQQMEHPALLWKPDLDVSRHEQLGTLIAQLEGLLGDARGGVAALERSYETAALNRLLQQLELLRQRYVRLLDQCRAFLAIALEIGRDAQSVERLARDLQSESPSDWQVLERCLDEVLDHCDRHADQLDAWERARIDIAPVHPVYRQLIQRVTALQSLIDDVQSPESVR